MVVAVQVTSTTIPCNIFHQQQVVANDLTIWSGKWQLKDWIPHMGKRFMVAACFLKKKTYVTYVDTHGKDLSFLYLFLKNSGFTILYLLQVY